ncbi:MAG: hypothetical protein HQK54_14465, partial [Oligoflexales bacterium]|nr:hypothetical protein [Oligoflexales bacterium]
MDIIENLGEVRQIRSRQMLHEQTRSDGFPGAGEPQQVIQKARRSMGIDDPGLKTSPKIMAWILRRMNLHDFMPSNRIMAEFLENAVTRPMDLGPLVEAVSESLAGRHPAIVDFVRAGNDRNFFHPSEHVTTALHVAYVLEGMTVGMANDVQFTAELEQHFKRAYGLKGIYSDNLFVAFFRTWQLTSDVFCALKFCSISSVARYRIQTTLNRGNLAGEQIKELRRKGTIGFVDAISMRAHLRESSRKTFVCCRLNIEEALVKDLTEGRRDNALAAYALERDLFFRAPDYLFEDQAVLPEHCHDEVHRRFLLKNQNNIHDVSGITEAWVQLYQSWNLAFVLGSLDDLPFVLPKLLIPSLLDIEAKNYLYTRGLSLWLVVHSFLFRRIEGVAQVQGPDGKEDMARIWGRINREYIS